MLERGQRRRRHRSRRRRELLAGAQWVLGFFAIGLVLIVALLGAFSASPGRTAGERSEASGQRDAQGGPERRGRGPERRSSDGRPGRRKQANADRSGGDSVAGEARSSRGGRPIRWRRSVAVGSHSNGRLVRGVLLPAEGGSWVSWDPIEKRSPARQWRRWGTDRLIRTTLRVMRRFDARHPNAPKVPIGDLSRPEGGDFGPQYGALGHASHQNGLDVDVYYPRKDRRVRPPDNPGQVDVRLAQTLVDLFVAAGAEKVFVGPNLPLTGPPRIVQPLVHHDNHLHARLPLD